MTLGRPGRRADVCRRVRCNAPCLAALCIAGVAGAHPGSGIVVDDAGRVYYTDLRRIVRIDGGATGVAVPGVHTHAMTRAPDGAIRGEDSRYLGEDRYEHRTWALASDGAVTYSAWQPGFWPTTGIHRDAAGTLYWVACPEQRCTIQHAARGAAPSPLYTAPAGARIGALHVAASGRVVFVENDAIRRLGTDRTVKALAPADRPQRFGLWADDCGTVLATSYAARETSRMTPDGAWTVVHASDEGWGPSGVAVSPAGDVWVLEYSSANEARAVRADARVQCDRVD